MLELNISLLHRSVLEVPCSVLFVKHIEGSLSAPEIALDKAMDGRLQTEYKRHEQEDDIEVPSEGQLPFEAIFVLNFHKGDLPFTYTSVDKYARGILKVATRRGIPTAATAIHGPGAGLDTSEAMETMLTAFASELHSMKNLGNLRDIILVEKDQYVFDRLRERLKHLENKGIISVKGDKILLRVDRSAPDGSLEASALRQNSFRHLFVAMPFAREFNNLYYFGIKEPVEQRHLKCERVDQDKFVGDVVSRIKERISAAELVIADITGASANVFFEVGYAEGRGKPIILLSQAQDVPFDLHTRNQIRYDPQDLLSLSRTLGDTLDTLLADPPTAEGLTGRSTRTRRRRRTD